MGFALGHERMRQPAVRVDKRGGGGKFQVSIRLRINDNPSDGGIHRSTAHPCSVGWIAGAAEEKGQVQPSSSSAGETNQPSIKSSNISIRNSH